MNEESKRKPRKRLPQFNLKTMTCSQLASFLEKEPQGKERKQVTELRKRFAHLVGGIDLLKKCRDLPAQHHLSYMQTARHIDAIPEIEMKVGGGRPDFRNLPPFSKSLKKMHESLGLGTLHRWGKGAFRLKKP
jgi:hypothetical protein